MNPLPWKALVYPLRRAALYAASVTLLACPQLALGLDTGPSLPGLEAFDRAMQETLQKWAIPGAGLAVAKDGRLVLAKGYGYANQEKREPAGPETAFRVGSINKTLTAVMVLKLVEEGRLDLDQAALPILKTIGLVPATLADTRAQDISIRHLLQHTAGLDRDKSGDPFFQPKLGDVARRQHTAPVSCEAIIQDTLQSALDFGPGERFAYSNTGYCMLGKIVEAVSGESYASYASRQFLQPTIGKAFRAGKSPESASDEATYYPYPGEPLHRAAPGMPGGNVPGPYGSYSIENMDALGAWVLTPTDLLKFFLAIDGARGGPLLSEASLRTMREAPVYASSPPAARAYYGMGIHVTKDGKRENWWHTGSQPGLQTLALRTAKGYAWVVAFNSRPEQAKRSAFFVDFDRALWKAADSIPQWPQGDLF